MKALINFYKSSIGKKIIVALTGIALIGFIVGHLIGNLQIFLGPDMINSYAAKLQSLGSFLWVIRFALLAIIAIHIIATVQLVLQNRAARGPEAYVNNSYLKASTASRFMIISGITIVVFIIYHILHYTAHVGPGAQFEKSKYVEEVITHGKEIHRHNVYLMMIDGFKKPLVSVFYLIGVALLSWHVSHGFASVFQTLGLRSDKTWPKFKLAGNIFAILVFLGYASIPLAVLFKVIPCK